MRCVARVCLEVILIALPIAHSLKSSSWWTWTMCVHRNKCWYVPNSTQQYCAASISHATAAHTKTHTQCSEQRFLVGRQIDCFRNKCGRAGLPLKCRRSTTSWRVSSTRLPQCRSSSSPAWTSSRTISTTPLGCPTYRLHNHESLPAYYFVHGPDICQYSRRLCCFVLHWSNLFQISCRLMNLDFPNHW